MARRIFWQTPILRNDEELKHDRRVTWLELFFDLFIVVVVAEFAHNLAQNVSWLGVGAFIFLFLHLWWVWIGANYYNERFETEGIEARLFTFLQLIPISGMAIFAHHALGDSSIGFALSYALARLIITFLWAWGGYHDRRFRPTARRFVLGFSVSIALFVLSVFVPPPTRFVMWGMGLLIDIGTPVFTLRHQATLPRFSTSRLPERFGLFVIIVLGESIVAVVDGIAQREHLSLINAATGILGIALAFSLWWIYFDFINRRPPKLGIWWSFAWAYLHLPLLIAITATGAGLLKVVTDNDLRLDRFAQPPLADRNVSVLIGSSVGVALIVMALLELTLRWAPDEPTHPRLSPGLKLASGAIALLMGLLSAGLSVITLELGLLMALSISMIYGLYVWFTQELPQEFSQRSTEPFPEPFTEPSISNSVDISSVDDDR